MNFLYNLIFNGKIPYLRFIRRIALFSWTIPVLMWFLTDISFAKYGELGWNLLIAIMLIRPLADVLPNLKILRALVPLRKEFGILCGTLIAIHSVGFFLNKDQNIFIEIFNAKYWDFNGIFSWGIIGFLATLILLLTSNAYSMRLFKSWWKKIQQLTYLLFIATAIHIILIDKNEIIETLIPVVIVLILWILAKFKITTPKRKSENAEEAE